MTWAIYFSHWIRPPESLLTLNGWNIPFVNSVKHHVVTFDKKITWRPHIEMIKAKAFRTLIRAYALFKSERLSTSIRLTLHKALIRSVMTYVCSVRDFVADTHLIKLQHLENEVSVPLATLQGAPQFGKCKWVSTWHTCMTVWQNYAGKKQKLF
jgi:hypothetical protein